MAREKEKQKALPSALFVIEGICFYHSRIFTLLE